MCSLVNEMNLPDALIADLAQSLDSAARDAFQQAALVATASLAVVGPGDLYRALAPLQLDYFTPTDERCGWDKACQCSAARARALWSAWSAASVAVSGVGASLSRQPHPVTCSHTAIGRLAGRQAAKLMECFHRSTDRFSPVEKC
jgi:hypothetical protein